MPDEPDGTAVALHASIDAVRFRDRVPNCQWKLKAEKIHFLCE